MFVEYVLFYAIKKALGLTDKDIVKYSYSPFCLNAKVNSEYSKCKQIVIYNHEKECDIFFENSVSGGTVEEINKFGLISVQPIVIPSENELKVTPVITNGVKIHMDWR